MKRLTAWGLAWTAFLIVVWSVGSHAEPPKPIEGTIMIPSCGASFDLSLDDQRMLFVAWARTVAGLLSPEAYNALFDSYDHDDKQKQTEREIVRTCLGTGV